MMKILKMLGLLLMFLNLSACASRVPAYHVEIQSTGDPDIIIRFLTVKKTPVTNYLDGRLFRNSRVGLSPTGYISVAIYDENNKLILNKSANYVAPISAKEWWHSGVHFSVPLEMAPSENGRILVAFKKITRSENGASRN
jgi:hypothetical protein